MPEYLHEIGICLFHGITFSQTMHEPKIITAFPNQVEEIENVWITLKDGCKLAARIWLPVNARRQPVAAILEYLPYRKRDGTAVRDQRRARDAALLRLT